MSIEQKTVYFVNGCDKPFDLYEDAEAWEGRRKFDMFFSALGYEGTQIVDNLWERKQELFEVLSSSCRWPT